MTLAQIRESEDVDHIEVVFLESARFYRLFRNNVDFDRLLGHLREAMTMRHPLRVGTTSIDSDTIEDIQEGD